MFQHKKVVVVLPAYNAAYTLERTYADIPHDIVDEIVLVDDASNDNTVGIAKRLGIRHILCHQQNLGYGGNQKTCYRAALQLGADIIVMLHPDYQYDPRLISPMVAMVASGVYDSVIGSRILGNTAISGGMPRYKYYANRILTAIQNLVIGSKLSEFHSGYRAFSRRVIETLPLSANSDGFVFDNQMLVQILAHEMSIGEISCPTKYFPDASEIGFTRSIGYGFGVLWTSFQYRLWKLKIIKPNIFKAQPELRISD